jgi:hypothetical protein
VWVGVADPPRAVFYPRLFIWFKLIFWLLAATLTTLAVALALRNPSEPQAAIPDSMRALWFVGLFITLVGIAMRWGRAGARLARYALVLLALYYGGMWMAHQTAVERAQSSLPAEGTTRLAAWPMPANPLLWQSVATTQSLAYIRYVHIANDHPEWRELKLIDQRFVEALRQSKEARRFLDFARFASAIVEEREGGYTVLMQDLRFSLRMRAELDIDLRVLSVNVRW